VLFRSVIMPTSSLASQLFALSKFGATEYERNFTHFFIHNWIEDNWHVPIIAVTLYMAFCWFGQQRMACNCVFKKETLKEDIKRCEKLNHPFDLRLPLGIWNLFLSVFSFVGAFRTVPHLLAILVSKTYQESVCDIAVDAYGNGPCGFWSVLFILSKIPELIDTVFIVLRKKPLIFLHWYHHVTVLLFCWHAYSTEAASGLYFIAMNYTVHAIMYGYYCAQAFRVVPKNFPAYIITMGQISQMVVGTTVCTSAWYFYSKGITCHNDFYNLVAGALMYGSYLYLFMEFAYNRYVKPKGGKNADIVKFVQNLFSSESSTKKEA